MKKQAKDHPAKTKNKGKGPNQEATVTAGDTPGGVRITLAPPAPARLRTGATYLFVADFSEAGQFADEDCRTALQLSDEEAVVGRDENHCTPEQQSWTVWVSPFQSFWFRDGGPYPSGPYPGDPCSDDAGDGLDRPNPYPSGPYPSYEGQGRGEMFVTVTVIASVKNDGWTGTVTEDVPARWTIRRIA